MSLKLLKSIEQVKNSEIHKICISRKQILKHIKYTLLRVI